jgi:WD40 repeat protein
MHRRVMYAAVAMAAAAALGTPGTAGASASGAAIQGPRGSFPARASQTGDFPGAQLWAARLNGAGNQSDKAAGVAVGPDGNSVFVTGVSTGINSNTYYTTVAYNAATGARLWGKRYGGPPGSDYPSPVAISPTGNTVFVAGWDTVAYNAATGAQLWIKHAMTGTAISVSPDGLTVFVTGGTDDYATIAYDAATGAQRWVQQYDGPGHSFDTPASIAVSPDGGMVFVTGTSRGANTVPNYATIAYDATTGTPLWLQRYRGPLGSDYANSMAVSPTGSTIFVTGGSAAPSTFWDYTTVAYDAATGAQLWVRRYTFGQGLSSTDIASSVALSPSGSTVFVTGESQHMQLGSGYDYVTVAYNAATGAQLWVKRYYGPGDANDHAQLVEVSPTGATVYVTGTSEQGSSPYPGSYTTVAYNAATGAQLWVKRYNGPDHGNSHASALTVSPDGSRVLVTGYSEGAATGPDWATIAYQG